MTLRSTRIVFGQGSALDPTWGGGLRCSPRPPSRLGRGILLPHSSPPHRLRRFNLGVFGACLDHRITGILYL